MSSAITHHRRLVNGFMMHYVTAGKGPPLVLLHGWPQSWFEWRKQIPALAEKFTVIAPDLRGLGDSDKPDAGYDKRTLASDVHALVKSLGHEKIGLVGHDWGGAVAYYLSYDHPEMVERLFIFDMVPGLARAGEKLDLAFATRLWHVFFHGGNPDLSTTLIEKDPAFYLRHFFTSGSYNYSPAYLSEEEFQEYLRVFRLPGTIRAGMRYYAAGIREDTVNLAGCTKKLQMPVRAWGGEFLLRDLPPIWRAVAENVTGGMVPECGHFVPEEKPEFALREMLDFFAPLGR
jgi:haloacetate dehalogenase